MIVGSHVEFAGGDPMWHGSVGVTSAVSSEEILETSLRQIDSALVSLEDIPVRGVAAESLRGDAEETENFHDVFGLVRANI